MGRYYKHSGLSPEHLEKLAKLFLESERSFSVGVWGLPHRHGTANVHMLANLLLARGQIGRPGAGLCPVRGHSNGKATARWVLMSCLVLSCSIALTVYSVLNHQEKMGMV